MPSGRKGLRFLLAAAALALLAWWIVRLGPAEVARTALRADPLWFAASLLPLLARFLLWGWKWQRILARRAPIGFLAALHIQLAGSFVNLTTPTAKLAGGFLRALIVRKRFGWSLAESYGRAFADQATTALGAVLLFGLLAPWLWFAAPDFPWRAPVLALGLLALAGLAALVLGRARWFALVQHPALAGAVRRWTPSRLGEGSWVRPVLYPFLGERGAGSTLVPDLALAAGAFAMVCVANAFVLRALGVEADLVVVSAAVTVGYFVGVAVGAWGGVGVTEAALTALYVRFGIPAEEAAAGALLHRACFYAMVLAWGGWSFVGLGSELADARNEKRGPEGPRP